MTGYETRVSVLGHIQRGGAPTAFDRILGTIHIYPTWSEANKYAAGVWKKAHAPAGLLRWVERLHAWRRG